MGRSGCGHPALCPQGQAEVCLVESRYCMASTEVAEGPFSQERSLSGLRTARGDVLLESLLHRVWSLGQGSSSLGGASPCS